MWVRSNLINSSNNVLYPDAVSNMPAGIHQHVSSRYCWAMPDMYMCSS